MTVTDNSNHSEIQNIEPKAVWQNFANICAIPHPSKKEQKLVKFMQEFGNSLNLETTVDVVGNVIIKKPATAGMENHKGVVLQAHIDMVPQKEADLNHDFDQDPIEAYVDGDWVKAKGTTLGADNGIGVATMMAILQATDLTHGPLEALFTVDEETGMTGAYGLKPNLLKGEILLNLDTEDDDILTIGCAGGIHTDIQLNYTEEALPTNSIALELKVNGLKSGHSGADIHLGHANAIKLINRVLWQANKEYEIRIIKLESGNLHNVIPGTATAIITIAANQQTAFTKFIAVTTDTIKQELAVIEPNLAITINPTDTPNSVMNLTTQNQLLNAIFACHNGVLTMSAEIPGLVETSSNLAHIKIANGAVTILSSQRSPVDSQIEIASHMIGCIFELIGAKVSMHDRYPGWKPNIESSIVQLAKKTYTEKFGQEPTIEAIHAGLECGLIGAIYPNIEMVSIGATIRGAHTTKEKVSISSVAKSWDYLTSILKQI
ncbi:MAG: aminoacyl-histidine dipeptidase [Gammaproteobacteria bacterium]|nr:aminoacyl-histidine dipeptidase [Gammaproteobacteria bacterium]